MTKTRGYSHAFHVRAGHGRRYLLDQIPPGLWRAARQKATRDGVSMRTLLLTLLTEWLQAGRP